MLWPTNFTPFPTTPDRQLALTIYRLAHGCTYSSLSDLFGVFVSTASKFLNCVLSFGLYNQYVYLPRSDNEWEAEVHSILENYEFPCVGVWDGFHVYVKYPTCMYHLRQTAWDSQM